VRADVPRTFRYCYPLNAAAPLVESPATVRVTSAWGSTSYCAEVTVTTDSSTWRRWQTTVGPATPGVTEPRYHLARTPEAQGASTSSFASGTWAVRGVSHNQFVRAGSPATFTYCQTG
jgi:signal peptidase